MGHDDDDDEVDDDEDDDEDDDDQHPQIKPLYSLRLSQLI